MRTLSKSRRSFLGQLRFDMLPLEIEIGRYTPTYDDLTKKNRKRHLSELYNMGLSEDDIRWFINNPCI